MTDLSSLRPRVKHRLIDCVQHAGFDVSDWANFQGGTERAAANPKYCYEWAFREGENVLLNLWHDEMLQDEELISTILSPLASNTDAKGPQKARARKMHEALSHCFESGVRPRVIILRRSKAGTNRIAGRYLDHSVWTVTAGDAKAGVFTVTRGRHQLPSVIAGDPELDAFVEGKIKYAFIRHRTRERQLRDQKIADFEERNDGRLFCEVPGCGFNFLSTYGEIGRGFAHVHHRVPLSKAAETGVSNSLDDLEVVCPNCHAMIHRGGQCRSITSLIHKRGN